MILQQTFRETKTDGEELQTHKMHVSKEAENHLIRMATEWSYKSPLESGLREAVSNAVDSHIEAGNPNPVIVKLSKNNLGKWLLQIIDEGLGLDNIGFKKYIMGVGESTKRNNPKLLGGYGAGAKAFVSYDTGTYEYLIRKDGIERKYLIFKGEEIPEDTLLYEKNTDEKNGVIVSILLSTDWDEYNNCIRAIKEQLSYLDNIYYDIQGFDNNFKIFRNELFEWNSLHTSKELHISLKGIYYPISWSKLGINRIDVPVALKFDNYDFLQPVFNREELIWSTKAKEGILKRINEVADWFINRYNQDNKEFNTLKEALPFIGTYDKTLMLNDKLFSIRSLQEYSKVQFTEPKIKGVVLLNPSTLKNKKEKFLDEYTTVAYDDYKGTWKKKHLSWELGGAVFNNNGKKKIVWVDESLAGRLKEYLRDKHGPNTLYIEKEKTRKLTGTYSFDGYKSLLLLVKENKHQWRDMIKEWQIVQKTFEDEWIDERGISGKKEFLEWEQKRKEDIKNNRAKGIYKGKFLGKEEGDMTIAYARLSALDKSSIVFEKKAYPIKDLYKNQFLSLYWEDTPENKQIAATYYHLTNFLKLKIALIGKRELNKLPKIHNFMEEKDYMYTKQFRKFATSLQCKDAIDIYNAVNTTESIVKNIVENHYKDVETIKEYYKNNFDPRINEELRVSIAFIAEKHNLYDEEMMVVVRRVKNDLKRFDFLSAFKVPNQWDVEGIKRYKRVVNQMLLFKKLYEKQYPEFDIVEAIPAEIEEQMYIDQEGTLENCEECKNKFEGEGTLVDEDFVIKEIEIV